MKGLTLRAGLHVPRTSHFHPSSSTSPLFVKPVKPVAKELKPYPPSKLAIYLEQQYPTRPVALKRTAVDVEVEHAPNSQKPLLKLLVPENGDSRRRIVVMGAVSVGILLLLSGLDEQKAWALGPEGPLVEEFWDNVRRYALYALTVSTGAIYTIVQPILELLKNPISAILIIAIFGGSIYIVSQVLSAMVGVSDFSYEYGY